MVSLQVRSAVRLYRIGRRHSYCRKSSVWVSDEPVIKKLAFRIGSARCPMAVSRPWRSAQSYWKCCNRYGIRRPIEETISNSPYLFSFQRWITKSWNRPALGKRSWFCTSIRRKSKKTRNEPESLSVSFLLRLRFTPCGLSCFSFKMNGPDRSSAYKAIIVHCRKRSVFSGTMSTCP